MWYVPASSSPAAASRWRVAPHARAEIILLQFQSHTSGQYDGMVHIKTNFEDMVVPVELSVMRGGLTPSAPMVVFFGFTSDRVRMTVVAVRVCMFSLLRRVGKRRSLQWPA